MLSIHSCIPTISSSTRTAVMTGIAATAAAMMVYRGPRSGGTYPAAAKAVVVRVVVHAVEVGQVRVDRGEVGDTAAPGFS